MSDFPEGRALVYCEGALGTTYGKTTHGLLRRSERYEIAGVIDSRHRGRDAGTVMDGKPRGIPVFGYLQSALMTLRKRRERVTHFVFGVAPDGGRLPAEAREEILRAIDAGLHVDAGLHDFLADDSAIAQRARARGVRLRDVRRPPPAGELHAFTGKIEQVASFKVAVLGTDSAIGKRTTAWMLVDALREAGLTAELIGTGQTAWMQGVRFGIVLDSLISDFVAGEIEHVVWTAWNEQQPDVLVLEGQGSLMNPAYPGGFELLAAGRPDVVIMQHAPERKEYDGFPGYPLHPLTTQIQAVELLSGRPVVALALNREGIPPGEERARLAAMNEATGLPAFDVLAEGAGGIADVLRGQMPDRDRP